VYKRQFLDVRDAAANILENTTLADLIAEPGPRASKGKRVAKKKEKAAVVPMLVAGGQK